MPAAPSYKNPDVTVAASDISGDLRFMRMAGREGLGRLFEFELLVGSESGTIDILGALDVKISIKLHYGNQVLRYFHGHVASMAYVGAMDLSDGVHRHLYRIVARPKAWKLTHRADCRIFQQKSANDIIKQVLDDAGLAAGSDYDMSKLSTYGTREYCVQYRETDMNFIQRLMEEEGIYYFFKHEESKHTMVLCHASSDHETTDGYDKVPYHPPDAQPRPDHINNWNYTGEIESGKYTIRDYNFKKSTLLLEAKSSGNKFSDLELYDYPGIFLETSDGETRAGIRLAEQAVGQAIYTGGGPVYGLATGALFTLQAHPREDQNTKFLIVESTYDVESDEYREAAQKDPGPAMQCDFRAILSSKTYRPPRTAVKPFVQGPQTAIVVGPSGDDDIYTDEFGRVKVQFFWDRVGKKDENSSCWIRVASIWAGNGWGAYQLPRLKQEVIVDFLEGDPDKPIITGRIHNDANKFPYTLPGEKTKSWLKSRSTTKGTDDNFNELRFEDKKDSEEIYFHAEKDFNRVVENNDTLKVGFEKKNKGDQTIDIFNNQKVTIGNDKSDDGSQTIDVWKNRTVTIHEADEKLTVSKGNRTVTIEKGDDTHKVSTGNRLVQVAQGNDTHKVDLGNREVKIAQGNDTLEVTAGNISIKATAGKITIEAGQSIELKVGGSSIKIEAAKITVAAPQIAVNGDAKVDVAAPMTNINGDGAVKVQGGMVKIN